jgi:hypothetical protein
MSTERKESRKKLMAFTPVYELLHKKLLGYVVDLTLKGVMVSSAAPVEVDRRLVLGIEFPENQPETPVTRVAVSARVAWCRQEEGQQDFNIGFEFVDVPPENARIIEAILERYQFRPAVDVSDLEG